MITFLLVYKNRKFHLPQWSEYSGNLALVYEGLCFVFGCTFPKRKELNKNKQMPTGINQNPSIVAYSVY